MRTEKSKNPAEYREKLESLRVSKCLLAEYRKKVECVRVSKSCWGSTGKAFNQCVYRKMVESGSVQKKGRIRASIEKLMGRVPEDGAISVRIVKW